MTDSQKHPMVEAIAILRDSLSAQDRLMIAIEAARACDDDDKQEVIAALAPTMPDTVPFGRTVAEEAESFFALADVTTVKIYAAAAWRRMDKRTRAGFVAWMQNQTKEEPRP
jgi:hypothetical protein